MMKKKTSTREKGITLIALIVTIIVLLILAGVTINLAVNNQGIFNKAKTATRAYKNATEEEEASLALLENEIDKYIPKNDDSKVSEEITYTENGETKTLTKSTAVGTKIGTTANISGKDGVTGVNLDWYLFDVSDDGKTAYLVSTPTYWVPDTTKEVSGAWVPKLVSSSNSNTGAIRQAIQKKASGTAWNSYTYEGATYKPSENTWNYFKSVNPLWSTQRGSKEFASLNENEKEACYLADADIFAGIKDQVNNAGGNLKGKIQTLVGGASAEQWCNAYNKQSAASNSKITCAYQSTNTPGYIYIVNDKQSTVSNSDYLTGDKTIVGNDIYGAAYTNNRSDNSTYPFSSCYWWLASPSARNSYDVCLVYGYNSGLNNDYSGYCDCRFSLFASVSL